MVTFGGLSWEVQSATGIEKGDYDDSGGCGAPIVGKCRRRGGGDGGGDHGVDDPSR